MRVRPALNLREILSKKQKTKKTKKRTYNFSEFSKYLMSTIALFEGREFQYGPALAVAAQQPDRVLVYYPLGSGKTLAAIHAAKTFLDRFTAGEIIVITTKINKEITWRTNISMYTEIEQSHFDRIDGMDITNIDWWFSLDNGPVNHYNKLILKLTKKGETRLNCIKMTVNELLAACRSHELMPAWRKFSKKIKKKLRSSLKGYVDNGDRSKMADIATLRRLSLRHGLPINQTMLQQTIPTIPYMLIVDESQEYLNYTAQTEMVNVLADQAKFTLLLSATPIHDHVKARGLRRLLNYSSRRPNIWKKQFLYTSINLQRPETVAVEKRVTLSADEWLQHKAVKNTSNNGQQLVNTNAYRSKTRMVCNSISKWDAMSVQIGTDINQWQSGPQRIVVYSFFVENGIEGFYYHLSEHFGGKLRNNKIGFKCASKKVRCSLLATTSEGQVLDLAWFNDSTTDYVKILFLSSRASKGISLKNVSSFHLMEPQWSDAEEQQAIGRTTRKGSHDLIDPVVRVYHWIAIGPRLASTADEEMWVQKKQKKIETDRLLEKWQQYGTDRLRELLMSEQPPRARSPPARPVSNEI